MNNYDIPSKAFSPSGAYIENKNELKISYLVQLFRENHLNIKGDHLRIMA